MRKLVVLTFVTLDGVMQAPGGPEEDSSGGFKHGGWSAPYWDDFMGNVMTEQMKWPFDLLLGRKTYEIFADYWPKAEVPGAKELNSATKFVVSTTLRKADWAKSVLISGDVVQEIRKIKEQSGPELQVHGSGKRLFAEGTVPAGFKLIDSSTSLKGVIVATYGRAGEVKTGSFAEGPPQQSDI
ncbi:MAG: dihydrofolate reductase family protein [Thaumarchaeota archaeon]|nr:dihydrofolate reductase family protein [Nitrososphaerota archaeon]